jgi:hypothetical protein
MKEIWILDDLYNANFPPRKWVIDGLVHPAISTQFFGLGKTGKTHFMLDLALHVAYEEPDFLGLPISTPGPVLYYMLEERDEDLAPILQTHPLANPNFYPESMNGQLEIRFSLRLSNKNDWAQFQEACTRHVLCVIDSLTALRTRLKKSSPEEAKELMFGLNDVARETGCAIVFINHAKKPSFMEDTLDHKASDEYRSGTFKGAGELADLATGTIQLATGKNNPRLLVHASKHAGPNVIHLKRVFRGNEPWWTATQPGSGRRKPLDGRSFSSSVPGPTVPISRAK